MGRLANFRTANDTTIQTYLDESVTNVDKVRGFNLQECLANFRDLVSNLSEYDQLVLDIAAASVDPKDDIIKLEKQVQLDYRLRDISIIETQLKSYLAVLGNEYALVETY